MESFESDIVARLPAASAEPSASDSGDAIDEQFLEELQAQICSSHGSVSQYLEQLLDGYVQQNYLGPTAGAQAAQDQQASSEAGSAAAAASATEVKDATAKAAAAYLEAVCGEAVFAKARELHRLALGQFLVDRLPVMKPQQPHLSSLHAARLICLLQGLLDEKSPALHARLMRLLETEDVESAEDAAAPSLDDDEQKLEHLLLLAQLCLAYFEGDRARRLLARCQAALGGLDAQLSGAPGVRTRFQRDSHAQLYLAVRVASSSPAASTNEQPSAQPAQMPLDVASTDDTLLPTVRFTDADAAAAAAAATVAGLTAGQQACLLLCADLHRRTRASDGIVDEELLAYASALLVRPANWCVATAALLRRSRLELAAAAGSGGGSTRRLERALQQLEELSGQTGRPEPAFSAARRPLFYACGLPTVWQLEVDTADALMAVGSVTSALDVYLRWDRYSQVIACYQHLEKPALAERIIRQRLAEAETPELYCALAEVTRDWSHLATAWRISAGRCSRAPRSLGYIAMVNGQYAEAMAQFELSLAANHLQPKAWFTYGCCCLQADALAKAELAFRRSAQLAPDNYEAWTNLGTVMAKQGNKAGACAALREALRSNWEHWRVWDNYLAVCTDTGHFGEAVRAFHRLLELRPKYWDPHSAGALVRVVVERLPDAGGDADCHVGLRPQLLTLFGRLAAQATGDAEFWWLYARLIESSSTSGSGDDAARLDAETKTRMLQMLQRCHRCDTQPADWHATPERRARVLARASAIAERYIECAADCPQSLLSGRLMVNALLARPGLEASSEEAEEEGWLPRLRGQLERINALMALPAAGAGDGARP